MYVAVFKRRGGWEAELEKAARKLRTILSLLEKRRKRVAKGNVDVVFSTADGRDVERIVRDALQRVERTLEALRLAEKLRAEGWEAEAVEGAVIVRSEEFDHFAVEAEKILRMVEEVWKEKRGEGGG